MGEIPFPAAKTGGDLKKDTLYLGERLRLFGCLFEALGKHVQTPLKVSAKSSKGFDRFV